MFPSKKQVMIHCNVTNDKISQKEWNEIESRMYPGSDEGSETGFLKVGEKLKDVIDNDRKTLEILNITHKQITDRLRSIVVDDNTESGIFDVSSKQYRGGQTCPFKNEKLDDDYHWDLYGTQDITITNTKTKKSITFSSLLPHMIEAHQFFEGTVPYRLDPMSVIQVLEIKPGMDYSSSTSSGTTKHKFKHSNTPKSFGSHHVHSVVTADKVEQKVLVEKEDDTHDFMAKCNQWQKLGNEIANDKYMTNNCYTTTRALVFCKTCNEKLTDITYTYNGFTFKGETFHRIVKHNDIRGVDDKFKLMIAESSLPKLTPAQTFSPTLGTKSLPKKDFPTHDAGYTFGYR